MRAITSIGLIFAGAGGLFLAAQGASSETERQPDHPPLVVLPTSMNAGAGLQLASYGVAELTTDEGVAISTLHVRAVIANTSRDLPWALDVSKTRVELASGQIAPVFANSDLATLPIAVLDPGERRTIDFYFPLPAELADHGGPMSFMLTWAINTPAHIVRNAWFERAAAVVQPVRQPDRAGWGPHWWFDPKYPWPAYRRRPGIVTRRPPSYVIVTRAPRWEEMPLDANEQPLREAECDKW
jgi:hypothetical protein